MNQGLEAIQKKILVRTKNMKSDLEKLEDGTIKLTITIPQTEVKKTWEEIVEELVKNATVSGFRKGKAPKKIVEQKINKEEVKEEVLKRLLPKFYLQAVKEHDLKPIINPKVHIDPDQIGVEKLEEETDWQFTALTCEIPQIDLGKYKQNIQGVTAKGKIVIPGTPSADGPQTPKLEEVVAALLESISVAIPKILLDGEVERLLAQTLDEIKRLGLTLDQYLASTHRTPDDLRAEYAKKAENDIKLEFALQKIAEEEKIIVSEKEIEEAIQKAQPKAGQPLAEKDEGERKNLESNRYLLASILRQQKTLDFLRAL